MSLQPQFQSQLDHGWELTRRIVAEFPASTCARLVNALSADKPGELLEWMQLDPHIASVVQHVALLAIQQAANDLFQKTAATDCGLFTEGA